MAATKKKTQKKKQKPIKVDYFKEYGRQTPPLRLNSQEFRVTAIRKDLGNINIDGLVETIEWRDEGSQDSINSFPVLRGTLGLRKPAPGSHGNDLHLNDGHVIKCDVFWSGRWTELWRMRIQKPTLGWTDGTWSFDLADDFVLAAGSTTDFKYLKGKKRRKKGWKYHQIVRDICRRFHIPLGSVQAGKEWITSLKLSDATPLDAIRAAVKKETDARGNRLVIVWRYNRKRRRSELNIVPMRRNKVLYQFKDQIRGADLSQQDRKASFATALVVRGVRKHGKHGKRKKVNSKVVDRAAVKKYGYMQRDWKVPGTVTSVSQLRRKAKLELRKRLKVKKTIENFSHAGVAVIRRGDAVRVTIPEEGYKSKDSFLFVTSVVHTVSSGDYTMTCDLGLIDPMDPNKIRAEREKAARAKKRAKKGKH